MTAADVLVAGAVIAALIILAALLWRLVSRRRAAPCPAWLVPLLENPYVEALAGAERLLDRADVGRAMRVLDVGPGPGRLTIPAARRVRPEGRVVALEIQPAMLRRLEQRLAEHDLGNVEPVLGGAGEGKLSAGGFDRAFLVTVLGEIVDKRAALAEIHRLLKTGGVLSITEVFPDPHYQRRSRVIGLAESTGFRLRDAYGTWLAFTLNFEKPDAGSVS